MTGLERQWAEQIEKHEATIPFTVWRENPKAPESGKTVDSVFPAHGGYTERNDIRPLVQYDDMHSRLLGSGYEWDKGSEDEQRIRALGSRRIGFETRDGGMRRRAHLI